MSYLQPALARRIDRLARRAHRFHRFAHHPLCTRYAREVMRLGRRARVCRGCALAAAGALVGAIVGAAAHPLHSDSLAVLLLAGVPLAALAVAPRRGRPRPKLLTRALPAALAATLAAAGLRAWTTAGLAISATTLAACALAVHAYRLRGPDRAPCADCPERTAPATCAGLRRQIRREAAFARLAGRWIAGDASRCLASHRDGGALRSRSRSGEPSDPPEIPAGDHPDACRVGMR